MVKIVPVGSSQQDHDLDRRLGRPERKVKEEPDLIVSLSIVVREDG
jgi:predicted class III extradiol MEMO1 family dioxygenase